MEKKRNPESTRQLILEAAEAEFSEKGLFGARIDCIAQRAGVNKRMIYAYYGDKEALYRYVLTYVYERIGTVEQPIIDAGIGGRELLEQLVSLYFDFLGAEPNFVSLLMWENLNHGKFLAEVDESKLQRSIIPYFIRKLEEGKACGIFRPEVDSWQAFISIITTCFANFSNQHTLSRLFGANFNTPEGMEKRKYYTVQMVTTYLCIEEGDKKNGTAPME